MPRVMTISGNSGSSFKPPGDMEVSRRALQRMRHALMAGKCESALLEYELHVSAWHSAMTRARAAGKSVSQADRNMHTRGQKMRNRLARECIRSPVEFTCKRKKK